MFVELYINGERRMVWQFDNADYRETWCEEGFEEKKRLWDDILTKCEADAGELMYAGYVQFIICIKSRAKAEHVTDKEYEEFVTNLALIQERKLKIKRRIA